MPTYKPTAAMKKEAQIGLDWREEYGRGGTRVGAVRARQIVRGENLSEETVKRMYSFFSRHEVDKKAEGFRPGEKGYPSNGAISWKLWGSDPGFAWSKAIVERLKKEDDRAMPGDLSVGDFVSWNSAGGRARGKIIKIERDGKINIPNSDLTITGTEDDPAALIQVYRSGEPTDVEVGHKFSTLRKIDPIRENTSFNSDEEIGKHPLLTNEEKSMLKEDRHILNVSEDDNSVVIEFSKHGDVNDDELEDSVELESSYGEDEEERSIEEKIRYRTIDLSRAEKIDEEKRMVRIGVSSEQPVERSFGMEVLSHKSEHIDMEFMSSGRAPLLLGHNHDEQIGVVREFYLDEENARTVAMVEFGKGQLASEIFEDVKAGIRQNISVGYMVNKLQRTKDEQNREYYLATSWTPLEASLVSIPADTSRFVGVGRKKEINTKVEIMSEEIKNFDEKAIRSEESAKAKAEALRSAKEILDLGKHHNQRELAEDAIANGLSIEQFRGVLLDNISNDKPLETAPADLGLNEKEKGEYSLLRAINAAATGDWRQAGYERELSDEIAKRSGKEARGFYVPTDLKWAKRDQTVGTDSQGGYLVGTDHLADQFIEALYARLTLANLGGQIMTGLRGDISIPKLTTSTSNAGFVAEGSAPTEGAAVFGQVSMSPKTLACYVDVSRKLMMQSDPSVEQVLRNDIVNTFARKIDEVGIEGGGSNEPSGILSNTDAATVAIGTNGGAITYSKIVDLIKEVEIDNAIIGDNPAFLTNPKVIAALRTVAKQASGVEGNFILDPNNTMLGYGVNSTTLVPSDLSKGTGSNLSALIFGDFSQLMMGFWSGVDVVVDTASLSTSGGTRLAFFQDMDIAIRHGEGFSYIKDIVAS